ncbi:VC_2705 family sodium/solute symporter [Azohydromonas aeria]|uniref:VC_2705 family sodium/solute symporter n=1 Tax=Azohydromonas aeria TaxID=2590212 RepID=UPI0012F8F741|nr:VC_2705 family sodium/solute symporter [Azohydromonas aeria]
MAAPPVTRSFSPQRFRARLHLIYIGFALGFIAFVALLGLAEHLAGLSKRWIGFAFLLMTVLVYAGIGILSRTTDPAEYYVAGRRVPAFYNGMATAADWMSAASFIGMAGTLYLSGFGGLAYIVGWTGGYCLMALLLAPYLRKFGQYTIPDFLGARYEGHLPRLIGAACTILVSFTYLVAQIYGVGLITARLTGLPFEVGVFVGLGGVLVCSFLGGMRAVTWTQVAQYIVLIVAYLVPVCWLAAKQTGLPLPLLVYGVQLEKVSEREQQLKLDIAEKEVIATFQGRADAYARRLENVPAALEAEVDAAKARVARLKHTNAPQSEIHAAERALAQLPHNEAEARRRWEAEKAANEARARPLAGMPEHAVPFAGEPDGDPLARSGPEDSRRNFLALVFCLMVGSAALPHVLTRYYTTPSVREARASVAWSLFFIVLLYVTAPALAVLVKYEIFNVLVGTPFDQLPAWIANWSKVDPALLSVQDVNGDGIFQLGEMKIGGDIIMLATPEIAGLPYVIAGMVAAGGLAAALSTADGLLLSISNALGHDTYYRVINPGAPTARRVTISKALLLVVALAAAAVAAQKPADILFLVSATFSLAASAFFPALVLGIFWKRATRTAACWGMVLGLGSAVLYMVLTQPWLRRLFGIEAPLELLWGLHPVSAGVLGVPVGFITIVLLSFFTRAPSAETRARVADWRHPG